MRRGGLGEGVEAGVEGAERSLGPSLSQGGSSYECLPGESIALTTGYKPKLAAV